MSRRRARGFTLLEVLIALAIVALSVGALLGAVTSSASNVIYIKDKTISEWVALNRLTEMRIAQQFPAPGKTTGKTDMAGAEWQWEAEVVELPIKGMFRIDVHVRPTGKPADDKHPQEKPKAQTDPPSSPAGSDLDDVAWVTTVTGVIGSSRSGLRQPVAAQYAGSGQTNGGPGGPNNPGGGNANPGAPGNTTSTPSNPPPNNPTFQPRPVTDPRPPSGGG